MQCNAHSTSTLCVGVKTLMPRKTPQGNVFFLPAQLATNFVLFVYNSFPKLKTFGILENIIVLFVLLFYLISKQSSETFLKKMFSMLFLVVKNKFYWMYVNSSIFKRNFQEITILNWVKLLTHVKHGRVCLTYH